MNLLDCAGLCQIVVQKEGGRQSFYSINKHENFFGQSIQLSLLTKQCTTLRELILAVTNFRETNFRGNFSHFWVAIAKISSVKCNFSY